MFNKPKTHNKYLSQKRVNIQKQINQQKLSSTSLIQNVLITLFFARFTVAHGMVTLYYGLFQLFMVGCYTLYHGLFFCNLKYRLKKLSLITKKQVVWLEITSKGVKKCLLYTVLHFVLRCYTFVLQISWSCKTLVLQRYTSFLWEFYPCASFSYSRYFL